MHRADLAGDGCMDLGLHLHGLGDQQRILCKALDNVPETVILGIEPEDIETTGLELTPAVRDKIDDIIALVLKELDNLGVAYRSNNLCV